MTIDNNPFEIMGLERLVEPQDADYIGKEALETSGHAASTASSSGSSSRATRCRSRSPGSSPPATMARPSARSRTSSGRRGSSKNIGYVWVPFGLSKPGTALEIEAPDGGLWPATTAAIPFIDPRKDTPKS